jgi:hypothetical protein
MANWRFAILIAALLLIAGGSAYLTVKIDRERERHLFGRTWAFDKCELEIMRYHIKQEDKHYYLEKCMGREGSPGAGTSQ